MLSAMDNKLSDQFYRFPGHRWGRAKASPVENIVQRTGKFSEIKNTQLRTTKTPQIDHKNTTKNHHQTTHFSQKTL
jgi:hypothetical protein